jgi:intracellular sulfur oxidation DsrE/DsrF family protein
VAVRQASETRRRSHERDLLRDAPDLTQAARDNPTTTAQESAREPQATQAPASDKPATAPLPANDKLVQAAGDKPATMATPTVPLEAPTDSPRAQQWVASIASSLATDSARARRWIASIASSLAIDSPRARQWIAATSLVVVLAATWWLYRSEVANHVEMTIPAATWAGDDELAQVKQALQQEHDKTEKLARELTTDLAQIKQVPQQERDKTEKLATDLVQVKQALQQDRDKTETLASELATDLAQIKQALQQQSDKTDKLTAYLAQIKQAAAQGKELASTAPAQGLAKKTHRLILQVNSSEPAMMNLALNNATNVEQYYKDLGEKVEIEIVTFGAGLNMLRDDTSPVKDRIKAIAEKTPSISFRACGNTQDNMGKAENKKIPLISQATVVKSGVVRVMELQEQGWTYVRP